MALSLHIIQTALGNAVNLKDLSQKLGLSPTTVSRALNGYPEVKEATREKVVAAAKLHNYKPNTRAIRLATGRAMAVGHVIPIETRNEIMNPVFTDFIAGAGETYSRAGYDLILSIVPDGDEARVYREMRSRGNVDGVIVHSPRQDDYRIKLLHEIGMPFVVHGRATGAELGYSWVDVNNRRAFRRATGFLLDLGHHRIGLINGLEFMDFAIRRRTGYLEALTEKAVTADPAIMRSIEMTEGCGYQAVQEMLAQDNPPTAFLISSIILALGARRAIEERGLAIGRDISIIIHDDDLSYMKNGNDVPIFTATRSSVRDAGRRAAAMLLDIIAAPSSPPQNQLLEAELIIGQSTGPAPNRSRT
jgi:LacI family transcriptional regulator